MSETVKHKEIEAAKGMDAPINVEHRGSEEVSAPPTLPTLTQLFINGEFVDAASGETFGVTDPRSGEEIARFASAQAEDVDRAVNAARKAFDEGEWPRMTGQQRARILHKVADLIDERTQHLANLESLDNGKPFAFSAGVDLPFASSQFRYYAGWADKITGETLSHDCKQGNMFAYTLKEPIGVVGAIIPWNFPLVMASWKLAPALAAGCTVVLKPSEKTPMTALELGQIFNDAGMPAGVVNILPGFGPSAGEAIAKHPGIDKIGFTGSVATALKIQSVAGMKPCTFENGGKSPAVIFADADIDNAVESVHFGIFFNHGQVCAASSRVFVHEDVYDEFMQKSVEKCKTRVIGDPFGNVDWGPQVDAIQFARIMGYIESGRNEGLKIATGGNRHDDKGFYIEPTIFEDVPDDSKIFKEEIFGPVLAVTKFRDEADVIKRCNDTTFGLAAGVFSTNINTINRVTRALKAGSVWVNTWSIFDDSTPFGGYKNSGIGREKGDHAIAR